MFISWLLQKPTIKSVSARNYLHGAKSFLRTAGVKVVSQTPITNDILKGHKRIVPQQKKIRKQLTFPLLQKITAQLDVSKDHDSLLLAAFYSIAFFGLVRLGELTAINNIVTRDIKFHPDILNAQNVEIHLRSTKTSQFGGRTLHLGAIDKRCCPVSLLQRFFLKYSPKKRRHFFSLKNGQVLSSATAIAIMRLLLKNVGENPLLFSGHSFRKGGAQSALEAGFTIADIKELEIGKVKVIVFILITEVIKHDLHKKSPEITKKRLSDLSLVNQL